MLKRVFFKNIKGLSGSIKLDRLNIIVGEPRSGKSTVLDVIYILKLIFSGAGENPFTYFWDAKYIAKEGEPAEIGFLGEFLKTKVEYKAEFVPLSSGFMVTREELRIGSQRLRRDGKRGIVELEPNFWKKVMHRASVCSALGDQVGLSDAGFVLKDLPISEFIVWNLSRGFLGCKFEDLGIFVCTYGTIVKIPFVSPLKNGTPVLVKVIEELLKFIGKAEILFRLDWELIVRSHALAKDVNLEPDGRNLVPYIFNEYLAHEDYLLRVNRDLRDIVGENVRVFFVTTYERGIRIGIEINGISYHPLTAPMSLAMAIALSLLANTDSRLIAIDDVDSYLDEKSLRKFLAILEKRSNKQAVIVVRDPTKVRNLEEWNVINIENAIER